jgi:hypothetical protein
MTDKERELFAEALLTIRDATLNFVKLADMAHLCVQEIRNHAHKMRELTTEIEKTDPGFLTKKFGNEPPPRT